MPPEFWKIQDLNTYARNHSFVTGKLISVPGGQLQRDAVVTNKTTVSPFYMSQYEITQAQFVAVTNLSNTSYFTSVTNGPVERVNWYHALVFCNNLSIKEGLTPVYSVSGRTNPANWSTVPTSFHTTWNAAICDWTANGYRLPTEAEWQWAAMGATDSRSKGFAGSTGSNNIDDYVWYTTNSAATTKTVGTKLPNELGIYDMSGNVWEWCWDWYGDYPVGELVRPTGALSGTNRVQRGGSWAAAPDVVDVAERNHDDPSSSGNSIGLRIVRSNTTPSSVWSPWVPA
ncbi:MAG: SUMF1/EgtB/PvdO family nonheme iron enzyme [Candidatus Riflebacteria bacterium]|nr:SUMF1/EgtB/PvdO family nonheme iron enzyme [Candidatus Riflebacteria bacterium]